ncbi:hypothetical protein Cabys_840 [Caldithrix abyssi DSM 13497]|uniref:Uncharacterized protein n=1 Tax=Caldithrix abyssi DSM 13497 TaxID=880073 RepID=A0A1J1C4L7_CALAY|nr:hypothetical protein Cabys_840 [Caldithrix abyssi DSM 13497]
MFVAFFSIFHKKRCFNSAVASAEIIKFVRLAMAGIPLKTFMI